MVDIKNKLNEPTIFKNFSLIIFSILILNFLQVSIEIKTLLFVLFSLIYMRYDIELPFLTFKNLKVSLFIIFIVTIITQNQFLNYEMISLDTPSYLVASQKVGINELPFETQWESKGPLFLYLYNFISFLSNENFVFFKILNDVILFFIASILFLTIFINKNVQSAFFGSLFFICLISYVWYHSEFSEIYCLVFISSHFYFVKNKEMDLKNIFLASILNSC